MFPPPVSAALFLVSCVLACFGATGCTNSSCIPSWALLIKVENVGAPSAADSVMVSFEGGEAYECPAVDGDVGSYSCAGNQGGTYTVTVTLDGATETQSAELSADACGVSDPEQLDFAFDPAAAGGADAN